VVRVVLGDPGPKRRTRSLVINPIIYAEVSIRFARIEQLDEALPPDLFRREALPWAAGFLAGKCFQAYRRRGGARRSPPGTGPTFPG
jgi:hypothetical protein